MHQLRARATAQCGTLGGGNHFIEVCSGSDGRIWLMLHSGSLAIRAKVGDLGLIPGPMGTGS